MGAINFARGLFARLREQVRICYLRARMPPHRTGRYSLFVELEERPLWAAFHVWDAIPRIGEHIDYEGDRVIVGVAWGLNKNRDLVCERIKLSKAAPPLTPEQVKAKFEEDQIALFASFRPDLTREEARKLYHGIVG